ncbi:LLM class flavin-dependent oxidoreductase [Jatrophihabitans endophyticus]|uniref:LLM class flavin-dependent oxidoreductase n=1 Tax=Jatrophihabitans endophyticus TaxID=1206085 RepID=UPI001A106739|nr:LLM class flavin-dependent oxidoreductase [Jatrophihabitans endophyticus]MBE7190196.1 LLM class flavin-dependent oxidoreductase [Jatrophihabitans endophyticus]
MRAATTVEGSGQPWGELVEFVTEAERLGLDICWVAEAWGADAVSVLGHLTARTTTLRLGSAVLQLGTRSAVAVAQAAISLSNMSDGRFSLGLGASGPQVIEGLHGVAFDRPLRRADETVQVIRAAMSGERIAFDGREIRIPRPGSATRPMRLSSTPRHPIPIYLASMSPKMLELTGRVADGWLGTSFVPEGSGEAYFAHLDAGLAAAGRTRAELDVCQGAELALLDDEDAVAAHVSSRKQELAFSLGGMGSSDTNFYNAAYARQGWADVAAAVREAWQGGDRAGAAALVTDEMVLATTLIGTETMVRDRLAVWRAAGVDTVRIYPAGGDLASRLDTLARGIALVHAA